MKEFTVRGITYKVTGSIRLKELASVYLVHKALEGDELAKEILDAAGMKITDKDGNQIYPPVVKK